LFFCFDFLGHFFRESDLLEPLARLSSKHGLIWALLDCCKLFIFIKINLKPTVVNAAVVLPLNKSQSIRPLKWFVVGLPASQHFAHFLIASLDWSLRLAVPGLAMDELGARPSREHFVDDLIKLNFFLFT
jgi:hypothetical protein